MRLPILPLLAGGMLFFAGLHILRSQTPSLQQPPPLPPTQSDFARTVAGSGVVEPRTENVAVGAHLPGVVVEVFVSEGQRVAAAAPLFAIDRRQTEAEVKVREAMLASARAQLARLRQLPRAEELPPIEARISESRAQLVQYEDRHRRSERLLETQTIPEEEFIRTRQTLEAGRAQLARLEAEDRLLRAGAWQADLAISEAAVAQAEAELERVRTELDRHIVRAPAAQLHNGHDGTWEVLQVNVRPSEYVGTPPDQPLIVLGDAGPRHIRVDVDEYDIPRFRGTGRAVAYARGDSQRARALQFVKVEPYVVPKKSLTGDSTERVDTRVLQVIYALSEDAQDVYVGQQMDVYIDAGAEAEESSAEAAEPPTRS